MIEVLASGSHYLDHLRPVAEAFGARVWRSQPPRSRTPTLCASLYDLRMARQAGRPVILMEHGAGQSYVSGARNGYVGGERDGVIAVLLPGFGPAAVHRRMHPAIPAFVVGCPKLDRMRGGGDRPVVSFHWSCPNLPETRNGLAHFRPGLEKLAEVGALGHGHPKAWQNLRAVYVRLGIEPVEHFADAIARASVYICDNSSTIFEAAALDVPVVVLNAPHYRRDVDHGMRFWEYADVGVQVSDPAKLQAAVAEALADPPERRRRRREIADAVYAHRGRATATAVEAIEEVLS